jgi:hypothetical protein
MAWILLCFDVLPTFETGKETHAMRHHNTVFHAVLKLVPHRFHRLSVEFALRRVGAVLGGVSGAKLHIVYNPDSMRPLCRA